MCKKWRVQIWILGYGCQIELSNICLFINLRIFYLSKSLFKNMMKKPPCSEINAFKNSDPVHLMKVLLRSILYTRTYSLLNVDNLWLIEVIYETIDWLTLYVCLQDVLYWYLGYTYNLFMIRDIHKTNAYFSETETGQIK